MKIDWFTFFAQIVNFLILVGLLRWLLYGRAVRAMQRREEGIADRFREAEQAQAQAAETIKQYERRTDQLEKEREDLLEETRQAAREEFQRMLAAAREDVDRQRGEWQEASRRQRDDLLSELRRATAQMGLEGARRILAELANQDLERHMYDRFAARLGEVDSQQRQEIARQLGNGAADVSVRTAFPMPDEQRTRFRELVRQTFGYDAEIAFQQSDELICGVELQLGGYRFGWNVKDLFHDMESAFEERLRAF